MTDPLALLPFAAAARGGRLEGYPSAQLVAAGLTLLRRSAPLVRALSGRRAGILLPPSSAFLTALAAADGRGALLINPLAAPPEIAHQTTDARAGAVFTIASLSARVPPEMPVVLLDAAPREATVVIAGEARTVDLGSHVGDPLWGDPDAEPSDEEAVVVYTSAMAGTPLGAILTHRNILSNAHATIEAAAMTADDHMLAVLPFAHLFGLTVAGITPLLAGARVTPHARFVPQRVVQALEEEGVTVLVGVPAMFATLAAVLERRGAPLRRGALRLCICGGAPLAPSLQRRWRELTGVELRQGYGLTEAGPVCLFNRVSLPNVEGALGVAFPGVEVTVRGPAGDVLVPGTEGEIWVAGRNVFAGYVSGGEAGLQRAGRWLRTGDLGVMDQAGVVRFRGVLKTMFTRNGFNIYPREIERVVAAMPGVRAARVRGVPDAAHEHEVLLEVEGEVTEDAVRKWCEARLAAYKLPGTVSVSAA